MVGIDVRQGLQPLRGLGLILDRRNAQAAIDAGLERLRPVALAAIVDAEDDVARLGQQLVGQGLPALLHARPGARPAIDLHHHRIFLRRIEVGRRGHTPHQGLAVALHRAELWRAQARDIRRERMAGVELVLFDPTHARAVDAVQRRLRRRRRVRIVADIGGRRPVHRHRPPAAARRHRDRINRAVQIGAEHLLLDRQFLAVAHRGGEIDVPGLFVDAVQMFDRIVAARDGPQPSPVAVVQIQVPPTRILVGPDEPAIRQDAEVVVQIDPGLRLLAEDHA